MDNDKRQGFFNAWKQIRPINIESHRDEEVLGSALNQSRLQRRDSVEDRIEKSIEDHLGMSTGISTGLNNDRLSKVDHPNYEKEILFKKLDMNHLLPLTKVLSVLSFFFKTGLITREETIVLKTKALEDDQSNSDGIIAAAVELLQVDHDTDECLDTFVKVLQMLQQYPE